MNSFLTNSFFSCKDRALERDRPYQRKKERWCWCGCRLLFCLPWWRGCLRCGPLPPGFPLPSPHWFSSGVFWSSQFLLVPPSGYLVVFATVYLWHGVSWLIGSCLPSASWQQRLRPRPCVGLCPLHHVVGVVHVPSLRY